MRCVALWFGPLAALRTFFGRLAARLGGLLLCADVRFLAALKDVVDLVKSSSMLLPLQRSSSRVRSGQHKANVTKEANSGIVVTFCGCLVLDFFVVFET